MIASAHPPRFRFGTYTNGQPYSAARGRYAPRERVEDRLATSHAVVNLPVEQPTPGRFLEVIIRELLGACLESEQTGGGSRCQMPAPLRWSLASSAGEQRSASTSRRRSRRTAMRWPVFCAGRGVGRINSPGKTSASTWNSWWTAAAVLPGLFGVQLDEASIQPFLRSLGLPLVGLVA